MTRGSRSARRVQLRTPEPADEEAFLTAVAASRGLHRPWVHPPSTPEAFQAAFVAGAGATRRVSYFAIERESGTIAGVFNLSEIVRGPLQSAYLGFYAFAASSGRGLMTDALRLVTTRAFGELRLHRVEANVQPANGRSLALVERCGFRREGFSPRYLRIAGRWRDHERWAILVEDWKAARREQL